MRIKFYPETKFSVIYRQQKHSIRLLSFKDQF